MELGTIAIPTSVEIMRSKHTKCPTIFFNMDYNIDNVVVSSIVTPVKL